MAASGSVAPADGRTGSTSLKDRSGCHLASIRTPVSLHKYLFAVEYAPMATHTNASDTCTWYNYADKDQLCCKHLIGDIIADPVGRVLVRLKEKDATPSQEWRPP